MQFSPLQLGQVQWQFVEVDSPAAEREAIARAIAWLYFYAGMQSPIWRDRGGNFYDDDTQPGRMDCIDHSTNTTAYLRLIERHGWLKHHVGGERVLRGRMVDAHWAARIDARGSTDERVVDTWVLDPGLPATVCPLQAWLNAARPRVDARPRAAGL